MIFITSFEVLQVNWRFSKFKTIRNLKEFREQLQPFYEKKAPAKVISVNMFTDYLPGPLLLK